MNRKISSLQKGLYLHVPFCVSKCNYCDFNSKAMSQNGEVEAYLNSLRQQLQLFDYKYNLEKEVWDTLYIGGGTPNSLTAEQLTRLFDIVEEFFPISKHMEMTMEINPNSLTKEKAAILASKLNRVSIGLQSTNSDLLQVLGRSHDYHQFKNAYKLLIDSGFVNISVDLIYGIPGQTKGDLIKDLNRILNLSPVPKHLSLYNLTIEENTPLKDQYQLGKVEKIEEDVELDMYYSARELLLSHGYQHYELSNFALTGYHCRHNMIYWKRGDYLGIGPGAHSFWCGQRFETVENIDSYLDWYSKTDLDDYLTDQWYVSHRDAIAEYIFLGLRLTEGIDLDWLSQIMNEDIEKRYFTQINELIREGLLEKQKKQIKLTEKGYMLSNLVFIEFLP